MSASDQARTAIGFLIHYMDSRVERRFRKLIREAPEGWDVYLLIEGSASVPKDLAGRVHRFDFAEVRKLARSVVCDTTWGNCQLPAIDFERKFPGYGYYWFIEYDVIYTGHWRDFFRAFEDDDADLLAARVRQVEPDWYWLPGYGTGSDLVPEEQKIAAFIPIYRASTKAMQAIARRVAAGWVGISEIVVPAAVAFEGLTIKDFGGTGPFTPRKWRGKNYFDFMPNQLRGLASSNRYGPPIALPLIRNVIHHPCKTKDGKWVWGLRDPLRRDVWGHADRRNPYVLAFGRAVVLSNLRALRRALRRGFRQVTDPEQPSAKAGGLPQTGHASTALGATKK